MTSYLKSFFFAPKPTQGSRFGLIVSPPEDLLDNILLDDEFVLVDYEFKTPTLLVEDFVLVSDDVWVDRHEPKVVYVLG